MQRTHLLQQLAHVLRTGTGSRLIGHRRDPLNEVVLEEAAQAHQHQRDGAVAADPVLAALGQRTLDDIQVNRIKDDHRVLVHAQRRRSVNPVAVPAGRTQLREDFLGVVAALACNDDVHLFERVD